MSNQTSLMIRPRGGNAYSLALEPNNSVFVGSGAHCRIIFDDEQVSPIHCRLWMDHENVLWVQDWNTGNTILNGRQLEDESRLDIGSLLKIGDNEIMPIPPSDCDIDQSEPSVEQVPATTESKLIPSPDSWEGSDTTPDESVVDEPTAENQNESSLSDIPVDTDGFNREGTNTVEPCSEISEHADGGAATEPAADTETTNEQESSTDNFQYDLNLEELEQEIQSSFGPSQSRPFLQSDDEEAELLRMEVEQLRFELAERDAQIRALNSVESESSFSEDAEEDTLRLVARLEDLLDELKTSDHRIHGLEELLRASDEATRAEQDERHQLEQWVSEVENRVTQREEESAAELSRFKAKTDELKSQLVQLQKHLHKAVQSRGETSSEADRELIEDLRKQLGDCQEKLSAASSENENFREQISQQSGHSAEEYETLEKNFMELQVSTSRERAQMARDREQLTRMKDELDKKLNSDGDLDDANSRIRAMREHLKEVHQQEQQERRSKSLGGRISRLLNGSSR